jgi:hypothetical protein
VLREAREQEIVLGEDQGRLDPHPCERVADGRRLAPGRNRVASGEAAVNDIYCMYAGLDR